MTVQNREECGSSFVEHFFQVAGGKQATRNIAGTGTVHDTVTAFAHSDDVAQPDFPRGSCQGESTSNTAHGDQETRAAEVMHDFHQVVA